MSEQVKVSINQEEWEIAEKEAKRHRFKTATAWIRHLIRTNAKEAA